MPDHHFSVNGPTLPIQDPFAGSLFMAGSVAEVTEHVEHYTNLHMSCITRIGVNRACSHGRSTSIRNTQGLPHARAPTKLLQGNPGALVQGVHVEAWILCRLRERMQILKKRRTNPCKRGSRPGQQGNCCRWPNDGSALARNSDEIRESIHYHQVAMHQGSMGNPVCQANGICPMLHELEINLHPAIGGNLKALRSLTSLQALGVRWCPGCPVLAMCTSGDSPSYSGPVISEPLAKTIMQHARTPYLASAQGSGGFCTS